MTRSRADRLRLPPRRRRTARSGAGALPGSSLRRRHDVHRPGARGRRPSVRRARRRSPACSAATVRRASRWHCARARGRCRCWRSAWRSAPRRSSTRSGGRVAWRRTSCSARPWSSSPSATSRCSPATASSTRRSSATRTRRRRGPTPPPPSTKRPRATACCSCPAPSSARSPGATPSIRRCPALTDRPLVTRDLLPLGSPAAMDLLYALDDRFQAVSPELAAVAPIARLFGADTIWLPGDAAFDRFRTPRPELTDELFAGGGDGLGAPVDLRRAGGRTRPTVPMVDEQALSEPAIGTPIATGVAGARGRPGAGRARHRHTSSLLSGSGDGLVDAAAAGLISGDEAIRYSASMSRRRARRRRRHRRRSSSSPTPTACAPTTGALAGRHRVHRAGHGPADSCGRTPATPGSTLFPECRHRRVHGGGCRTGRCRSGDELRRALQPTSPRPARRWPSTATRTRRGRCSIRPASTSRSRPTAGVDHVTLLQPERARATCATWRP